jgi:RNA polymerase sigma-70 factor (TIGR02960 family)
LLPRLALTEGLVSSDEPWWLEPCPDALLDDAASSPEARYDARESVALSFVAGLQRLPAQQRAVLVLRDVLGFSAAETAGLLDTTPASVSSALARARTGFRPGRDPEQVPLPRSAAEARTVERFVKAFQRGEPGEVAAVLTEDARLTMPPEPLECDGPGAIAAFLQRAGFWGPGLKLVPTRANNQPAFGFYRPDPASPIWQAAGLIVLVLRDDHVSGITRFDPALLDRFGLPRTMPRERQWRPQPSGRSGHRFFSRADQCAGVADDRNQEPRKAADHRPPDDPGPQGGAGWLHGHDATPVPPHVQ